MKLKSIVSKVAVTGENVQLGVASIILGRSKIGGGCYIGSFSIIGYPLRKTLIESFEKGIDIFERYVNGEGLGSVLGESCIIRSHSIIYETVVIGDYVETGHSIMIREGVKVGSNSKIGSHTIIDGNSSIGRNVNIQSGNYIPPGSNIEDDVFMGPCVTVTNDKYPVSKRLAGVSIGRGAVIGAGSVLIAGVTIGRGAVIGAGSVVTRDVDDETVVYGCPARFRCTREEYDLKRSLYESGES